MSNISLIAGMMALIKHIDHSVFKSVQVGLKEIEF